MSEHIETTVIQDPTSVDERLIELGLTRDGLARAVHVACTERNNATGLHPANAAGTFSYHHGVAALRREYVGDVLEIDRQDGIEAIVNSDLGIKVAFSNVDQACGINHPKPRSEKGAGAERASSPMLFDPDDLKSYAPKPVDGPALFYLMVDQDGRAELTRPVIKGGTFIAVVERIFLIDDDGIEDVILPLDSDDVADDFKPQIVRK